MRPKIEGKDFSTGKFDLSNPAGYSTVRKAWILISLEMQFCQDIRHCHIRSKL